MCRQYPLKLGTPRLCGVTPPLGPDLRVGLGVALAFFFALPGRAVLSGTEGELVACGCFFLCADGVADGDGDGVSTTLAGTGWVLGAGRALKPRLEAAPLPGATSTNAATRMPAMASGPAPNSRTFISVPRPPQDGRGTRRRDGADGLAKGPAAGVLGYQPTEAGSSGVSSGAGAAEAGAGASGAGGAGGRGGADSPGGAGLDAPKLGGIPPGPGWFPACPGPPAWSPAGRPSFPLTMAPTSPGVPDNNVVICRPDADQL